MRFSLFSNDSKRDAQPQFVGSEEWSMTSAGDGIDERRKERSVYSIWSGAKYVLILSLLLWWLPMFGQMIAGYVGGRKAGGPWRGILSALLPVIAIIAVVTIIDSLFSEPIISNGSASASLLAGLASTPLIGPYIDFTREYIVQFVSTLQGSSPYDMNSYLLTLAFAYIGGIIADQSRREIEAASGQGGQRTTIVVAPRQQEGIVSHPFRGNPQAVLSSRSWHKALPAQRLARPRGKRVERFDQLVPEKAVGMMEPENDTPRAVRCADHRSKARSEARNRSNKRKKRWPASDREPESDNKTVRAHPKKSRSKAVAHGCVNEKTPRMRQDAELRIDPRKPRTLRKADKMIENEWGSNRRKNKNAARYANNKHPFASTRRSPSEHGRELKKHRSLRGGHSTDKL